MSDRKQEIVELAALARLGLTQEEIERFEPQLDEVIEYLGVLASADVDGVPQWQMPATDTAPQRPDEASTTQPDALLSGAHELRDGSVVVPGFGKG